MGRLETRNKVFDLLVATNPHLCDGEAWALTIDMISSGVLSSSPVFALRMKPGVSMMVRFGQYAYLPCNDRSWASACKPRCE